MPITRSHGHGDLRQELVNEKGEQNNMANYTLHLADNMERVGIFRCTEKGGIQKQNRV